MDTVKTSLIELAKTIAGRFGLDADLVCAIVEQESAWDPETIRYEPAFFVRYVTPVEESGQLYPTGETEARSRAFSWGLMQIMGQCARELGFEGAYLSALCGPEVGLEFGCRLLVRKLALAGGDLTRALQLWNGGANSNYANEVVARIGKYREPGRGTE
jgi:soluble lytic murein transglycosylase-like protein